MLKLCFVEVSNPILHLQRIENRSSIIQNKHFRKSGMSDSCRFFDILSTIFITILSIKRHGHRTAKSKYPIQFMTVFKILSSTCPQITTVIFRYCPPYFQEKTTNLQKVIESNRTESAINGMKCSSKHSQTDWDKKERKRHKQPYFSHQFHINGVSFRKRRHTITLLLPS